MTLRDAGIFGMIQVRPVCSLIESVAGIGLGTPDPIGWQRCGCNHRQARCFYGQLPSGDGTAFGARQINTAGSSPACPI
jgi:hypothetical protein